MIERGTRQAGTLTITAGQNMPTADPVPSATALPKARMSANLAEGRGC
jgi:hypothetical protein